MEEEIVNTSPNNGYINLSDYITTNSIANTNFITTSSTNITSLTANNNTDRMRIASGGTIGIGTQSSPQFRLNIGEQKSFKFLRGYGV